MWKTSSRLLALLSLLQTSRDWSGDDLAERLDVTPRTVRRDVDRLRELGYPVLAFKGPSGGYRLQAGSQLPPLLFDDDQAVALSLALQSAAADPAIGEDAERALATLRQVLPSRLRSRIDTLRVTAVRPPTDGGADAAGAGHLAELGRVVHAREELRFDYPGDSNPWDHSEEPDRADRADRSGRAGHGDTAAGVAGPPRRVQPHHLVTRRGRWYLIAWDLDRDDWRVFRADRVRPRTPTGPRFVPRELPGGDVAAFLLGRFRGAGDAAGDWPCRGEVILSLPARRVAPFAQEGIVEELGPGRCRLTLGSWSWTALAAAVGRFDTDIHVVGPPALADAFARLATRCAAAAGTLPSAFPAEADTPRARGHVGPR